MAIVHAPEMDGNMIIVCDKCQKAEDYDNKILMEQGWTVNSRAKKYIHLCYLCKPKKQRQAFDFIKRKFNL